MVHPPRSTPSSAGLRPPAPAVSSLFELWTGPFRGRALDVTSFRGREEISRTFSFEVHVLVDTGTDLLEAGILGQPATFVIQNHGLPPRLVQGIVASVQPESRQPSRDRRAYRVRIVPRFWLLKHRITSRVFQDMTVPDIVAAVLDGASIPRTFKLERPSPIRAYCVQYQESDEVFVRRLLAEEGIFFWFEHPRLPAAGDIGGLSETVIFADSVQAYPAIPGGLNDEVTDAPPCLVLRDASGLEEAEDSVRAFTVRRAVRPTRALLRDYDFQRPLLDLRAEAQLSADGVATQGSAMPVSSTGRVDSAVGELRVYAHRGEYDQPEVNPARARTVLEQHRRGATSGEGASSSRRLLPGHRFRLEADVAAGLSGEYAVTRVEHEGQVPEHAGMTTPTEQVTQVYTNRFTCVPATTPFRPKRPKRVLRQVLESATVVGPPGEEIYTDEYGRIKVQFHWDLDGKRNERSSCWIRVAQAWAGTSFGTQFVPRVGMEALVTFLGGDQDCPVVMGTVSNATHPVPFKLPGSKTQSGIRTQSSPGGGGANELSFEDRAGAEVVRLIATRDLHEEVGNNHATNVTADQNLQVGGDLRQDVAGSRVERVARDRIEEVGESYRQAIGENRAITVHGVDHDTVMQHRFSTIKGDYHLEVGGGASSVVGSELSPCEASAFAWGDYTVASNRNIIVRADEGITLCCGDSAISITKEGIKIESANLSLAGTRTTTITGKGPSLTLGEEAELVAKTVRFFSTKASLELDDDAHVDGTRVMLNCKGTDPDRLSPEGVPIETRPLRLRLTDGLLEPYANKDYLLVVLGNRYEGKTDGDGFLHEELPVDAEFASLTLWLEERPTGKTVRYRIRLKDIPEPATPLGVQTRLKNLGYYGGQLSGALDPGTRGALRDFQRDHDLEANGELDEATQAKLREIHGH
ncbi:type VI secretion system tip protein TssI/VgrG [Sorangium sp. So ce185]|uniref:type VI secretion system tip protein TssI/VgrG n=1 Tax=Sorangium sp. So ce185 TaxID=3133287 RepID=UPI003F60257A